ncbi:MAG: hypothetical protein ACN4GZ_16715 [Acidimicrobiales bacterium]
MRRNLWATLTATILGVALFTTGGGALAQTVDIEAIVDEIEQNGFYLERAVTAETEAAIERANQKGVAFVRLDNNSQSSATAEEIFAELKSRGSSYGAVIVLTNASVFARGVNSAAASLTDDITQTFGGGDIAGGIDQYLANLGNDAAGGLESPDSGGGFPWIVPILLVIAGFFVLNMLRGRRKTRAAEAKSLETDRLEIIEQLKANADRVIELGDDVIEAKDPELISIYEEASAAYQNVSNEIRNASTVAEIDVLDDQIDKAEWQFEVIEAKLTGRVPPPFVDDDDDGSSSPQPPAPTPPPPTMSPAERDDQYRRQGQPPRPLPKRNPRQRHEPEQRGSGMSGAFGKMAMSLIISMLMGSRLGQPQQSRRSNRRSGGGYGGVDMPF